MSVPTAIVGGVKSTVTSTVNTLSSLRKCHQTINKLQSTIKDLETNRQQQNQKMHDVEIELERYKRLYEICNENLKQIMSDLNKISNGIETDTHRQQESPPSFSSASLYVLDIN